MPKASAREMPAACGVSVIRAGVSFTTVRWHFTVAFDFTGEATIPLNR
jgi:hypothetical protein